MRTSIAWMMIVAAMSTSVVARAQPATALITWQASNDGGATWLSHLTQPVGQGFKIRALASWTDGPVLGLGFAHASFQQIDLIGALPTDLFDLESLEGMYLPLKGDALSVQPGTGASLGFRKIDDIHPVDNNVVFGQAPKLLPDGRVNPFFDSSSPIRIFEIDVKTFEMPSRTLTISATWSRPGTPFANDMRIYTTDRGMAQRPVEEAMQSPVTIELIVPAPGGTVLFTGLSALAVRRRRAQRR